MPKHWRMPLKRFCNGSEEALQKVFIPSSRI
jgi:hypothetical protein